MVFLLVPQYNLHPFFRHNLIWTNLLGGSLLSVQNNLFFQYPSVFPDVHRSQVFQYWRIMKLYHSLSMYGHVVAAVKMIIPVNIVQDGQIFYDQFLSNDFVLVVTAIIRVLFRQA